MGKASIQAVDAGSLVREHRFAWEDGTPLPPGSSENATNSEAASMTRELSVLEICAGAGGQSYGLEQAGFAHAAAVEIEPIFADTLRLNRPGWDVVTADPIFICRA